MYHVRTVKGVKVTVTVALLLCCVIVDCLRLTWQPMHLKYLKQTFIAARFVSNTSEFFSRAMCSTRWVRLVASQESRNLKLQREVSECPKHFYSGTFHQGGGTKQTLTLQLLSSSALTMMVPHFFPGIPLGEKRKRRREEQNSSVQIPAATHFTKWVCDG